MTNDMDSNQERHKVNGNVIDKYSYLEEKVNVDRAAILEAIEQVGDDLEKVEMYLINNRGL